MLMLCVCVCVRAVSVSVCLSSELRFGIVTGVREFLSLVMESTGALSKTTIYPHTTDDGNTTDFGGLFLIVAESHDDNVFQRFG